MSKTERRETMFVGSINSDLRSMVSEITKSWDADTIYIGCSGNFTIERILKERDFNLHSNDVSIYTSAIGNHLAGITDDLKIKEPEFEWLSPYLEEGPDRIATLLLCTTMLENYHRKEIFFTRKRKAYREQWERLHAETVEKVKEGIEGVNINEYWAGDVVEWAKNAPKEAGFISFPPTYTGGYEKLYEALMNVFEWKEPDYEMFDEESLETMVEYVKEKKYFMMARDEPIPGLEDYEVGRIQTSLRSKPLTVYANKAPRRITMPHQNTEILKVHKFKETDTIEDDSKISIINISQAQMNTLRSLYLDPGIAPAQAAINIGVLIDDKLIGAIGLSKSNFGLNEGYLMSDFVIRPVPYQRLSKLILAVAVSEEVNLLLEQAINQRVRHLLTTAFTKNPVSMKYRGIFKLKSRKDDPPRLNYGAETGRWSIKEGFEWWKQNHMKEKV